MRSFLDNVVFRNICLKPKLQTIIEILMSSQNNGILSAKSHVNDNIDFRISLIYWSGGDQMRWMWREALINKFWVKSRLSYLFWSHIVYLIDYLSQIFMENVWYLNYANYHGGKWEPKLKEKKDEKWAASFA